MVVFFGCLVFTIAVLFQGCGNDKHMEEEFVANPCASFSFHCYKCIVEKTCPSDRPVIRSESPYHPWKYRLMENPALFAAHWNACGGDVSGHVPQEIKDHFKSDPWDFEGKKYFVDKGAYCDYHVGEPPWSDFGGPTPLSITCMEVHNAPEPSNPRAKFLDKKDMVAAARRAAVGWRNSDQKIYDFEQKFEYWYEVEKRSRVQ